MLVTLCRPVAGRVRDTDQTDVGVGGILVVLASEQGRDPVPKIPFIKRCWSSSSVMTAR